MENIVLPLSQQFKFHDLSINDYLKIIEYNHAIGAGISDIHIYKKKIFHIYLEILKILVQDFGVF